MTCTYKCVLQWSEIVTPAEVCPFGPAFSNILFMQLTIVLVHVLVNRLKMQCIVAKPYHSISNGIPF